MYLQATLLLRCWYIFSSRYSLLTTSYHTLSRRFTGNCLRRRTLRGRCRCYYSLSLFCSSSVLYGEIRNYRYLEVKQILGSRAVLTRLVYRPGFLFRETVLSAKSSEEPSKIEFFLRSRYHRGAFSLRSVFTGIRNPGCICSCFASP